MNSTIIELSRTDAVDSRGAGEWSNTIRAPIIVPSSSQILLNKVFINTAKTDDSNIYLPRDTTAILTFGYYDIFTYEMKTNGYVETTALVDYDYYIPYISEAGSVGTLNYVLIIGEPDSRYDLVSTIIQFQDITGKKYYYSYGSDYIGKGPGDPNALFDGDDQYSAIIGINNVVWSSVKVNTDNVDIKSFKLFWTNPQPSQTFMLTGTFEVFIPRGEYSRTDLAEMITDKMQYSSPQIGNSKYLDPENEFLRATNNITNNIFCEDVEYAPAGLEQLQLSTIYATVEQANDSGVIVGAKCVLHYTLIKQNGDNFYISGIPNVITSINLNFDNEIIVEFQTPLETEEYDSLEGIYFEVVLNTTQLKFIKIGQNPLGTPISYTYSDKYPSFFGSSSNSLEYNEEREKFAFTTLYTPYINDQFQIIVENIIVSNDNTVDPSVRGNYFSKTQQCGTFILDFSPPDFWQMLGFNNADHAVALPASPGTTISRDELIRKIPYAYTSLQDLFPDGNRIITQKPPAPISTTDTFPLFAGSVRSTTSNGYYLIEISLPTPTNYFNSNDMKYNIMGIVSKYNSLNYYITGYADSSLTIINDGLPFTLNGSIRVRILDPITKKTVENLGDNSVIFLELLTPKEITTQNN